VRERDVEGYLKKRVEAIGGHVRKVAWVGRVGAPDRLAFGAGLRPAFVELKRPLGGVVSYQQASEIRDLLEGGFNVFVLRSVPDVDCFITWMQAPE